MNKQEFLETLRQHLTGEIPDYEVESNIRYYAEYISTADGTSEEEKLIRLGEPRLIARTIIDAYSASKGNQESTRHFSGSGYDEEVYDRNVDRQGSSQSNSNGYGNHVKYYSWDSMKWYQKLIAIASICLIIVIVFAVAMVGLNLLVTVVLPVLAVIFVVKLILNLFHS